jgi:hypothetical protein
MKLELVHDACALSEEDLAVLAWFDEMEAMGDDVEVVGCFAAPEVANDGAMIRMRVSCKTHGDGCWVVVPVGSMEPAALLALAESVGPQCRQ